MMRLSFVFCWIIAALAIGLHPSTHAADPFAENVRTTPPRTAAEQAGTFRLPPGFEMQLVASEPDINKPFNMAFDSKGRLWVTTSIEYPFPAPPDRPGRDRLMIFEDFGPDGRARKVTEFAGELNIPIGIYPIVGHARFKHDAAIVWSIPHIWLMEDTNGDGKADKRTPLYGPFDHTRDTHGNQASFRRGFDGWLYATHGFNNDSHVKGRDGHEVHLNSGNTYRMQSDGSRIEHHTWGQVNPYGLAWDPQGNLYSSDCHSAPTYQLLAGGFYPSFGKPHDGLGFAPVLMEHSHGSTAIDGMLYYADNLWPEEYHGNIFVGNVMTSRVNRDRLEFLGSSPKAVEMPDLVRTDDPWFRPVDNQLGPDGAFYIADFYNRIIGHYEVPLRHPGRDRDKGRIWRLVYTGADKKPKLHNRTVDLTTASAEQLVKELADPNLTWRMLAANQIVDRIGRSATAALQSAQHDPQNSFQHVHALWALHRLNPPGQETGPTPNALTAAARSKDSLVRVHAARLAADMLYQDSLPGISKHTDFVAAAHQVAMEGLTDSDTLVRRCAAEALGHFPSASTLRPLLDLLARCPAEDTHLRYVIRKSIRDQLKREAIFREVLKMEWNPADLAALADVAVAVKSPVAATFLLRELSRTQVDRDTASQWLRHAARYAATDDLNTLAEAARRQLPKEATQGSSIELERQLALFRSVDEGLQQRGSVMPAAVRDWGTELARRFFASIDTGRTWSYSPYEPSPTANPWGSETRRCADGRQRELISSFPHGEALTGGLRSPEFECPERLSFWICGHDGEPSAPAQNRNRVRLRDASNGNVLADAPVPRQDVARRVEWNVAAHQGKKVFVEAIDGNTGGAYAWIAFGGLEPQLPQLRAPEFAARKLSDALVTAADLASRLKLRDFVPVFARSAVAGSATPANLSDPDVAAAFAKAWTGLEPAEASQRLSATLLDANCPPLYRERLGILLAETGSPTAHEAVLAASKFVPARTERRWAEALAGNAAGAETLLGGVESGVLSPRLLQTAAIRNRIQAAKPANWEARIARLTQNIPTANENVDRLIAGRRASFSAAVARPAEGARVFEKNCAVCHQIGGQGALVGPQLDGIGNRGLERLLEDIFDPNRNVDRAFRNQIITLKDGDVITGLFRRDEGELTIVADATGKEISIPKKTIQARRESETSLMPENFGEVLSPEESHDLLAFLLSKRAAESDR